MPRRSLIAIYSVCSLSAISSAQHRVSEAFAEVLQAKLDSCVAHYDVPGISATLLLPGDRFWNGAAGEADIYTHAALDTAYLFQQASVTKLFTATLIMQLVDEGSLGLDDMVGDHLPAIQNVPPGTRIRHLLKHRSGLADFMADPGAANSWLLQPNHAWTPVETIETFGADPVFAQGAQFAYCNTNFTLLGAIAEEVTGMPLAEAFRSRFFDPMGLEHTALRPSDALPGVLVPGWSSLSAPESYTDDMTFFLGTAFSSMVGGAGALVSLPWDIARFDRALFTGAFLPDALLDTMRTCTNVNMGSNANGYGFGTMRYSYGGRTYFGHGGDINGFTQMVIHNVDDSVTLALSINRNNAPRGPIAAALLSVAFEQMAVGLKDDRLRTTFDVSISPNPVHEHLHVRVSGAVDPLRIWFLDVQGREALAPQVLTANEVVLDVSGLAPGMYRCLVSQNWGAVLERAIIVE